MPGGQTVQNLIGDEDHRAITGHLVQPRDPTDGRTSQPLLLDQGQGRAGFNERDVQTLHHLRCQPGCPQKIAHQCAVARTDLDQAELFRATQAFPNGDGP